MFRVRNGKVTHWAVDGKILQAMGHFNTQVGSYEPGRSSQAKVMLKSIKEGVTESISVLEQRLRRELDALGNQTPTGPETPPEMPAGTIKVDVSDMYDWYKLGQHISDLKSIDKSTLGKGPPSTVFAFGSEELENKYSHELTNLGLKTHDLDEPGEEDVDESQEITKLGKLDSVLEKCIEMIRRGYETDPDKYGRVAACLIDNHNNHTYAINMPGPNHTRRHAEHMAIAKHLKRHGRIGPNAIMVTTLSPCMNHMDERYGESCTDLLVQHGIEKCYAGWEDPTQQPAEDYPFNLQVTNNADIFNTCKDIAASFLPQAMAENFADGRNPQDKGDSKRLGVPTKSSVSNLRKYAKSHSGRAAQLAHWMANMKSGKRKAK
jgi:pyrimidine deaminase RibD-like protein